MADNQPQQDSQSSRPFPLWLGIGAVLAGVLLLLERLNVIPPIDWWWPVILIAAGVGVILEHRKSR